MDEINFSKKNELLKYISEEEYKDLVCEFIRETNTLLSEINIQNCNSNRQDVIRALHTIKGSASSLGFDRLSNDASVLEEQLKKDQIIEKSSIFVKHNEKVQDFLNEISEEYK